MCHQNYSRCVIFLINKLWALINYRLLIYFILVRIDDNFSHIYFVEFEFMFDNQF